MAPNIPLPQDPNISPDRQLDDQGGGRGFLSELLTQGPIEKYAYKGREDFIKTWNRAVEHMLNRTSECVTEWILFTGVDEHTFDKDFNFNIDETPNPWTEISWTAYDATESLLLVNMPNNPPHETAAAALNYMILNHVDSTGLYDALRLLESSTFYGSEGGKNADYAYAPVRTSRGQTGNWPTVVVEVASTEPASKLMSDIRFWFHESQGDVQLVIALQINQKRPEITIEKWSLQNNHPHRRQQVTISKAENQKITVRGAPLIIEFDMLWLRPARIPRETDIALDEGRLESLAIKVWQEQEF